MFVSKLSAQRRYNCVYLNRFKRLSPRRSKVVLFKQNSHLFPYRALIIRYRLNAFNYFWMNSILFLFYFFNMFSSTIKNDSLTTGCSFTIRTPAVIGSARQMKPISRNTICKCFVPTVIIVLLSLILNNMKQRAISQQTNIFLHNFMKWFAWLALFTRWTYRVTSWKHADTKHLQHRSSNGPGCLQQVSDFKSFFNLTLHGFCYLNVMFVTTQQSDLYSTGTWLISGKPITWPWCIYN